MIAESAGLANEGVQGLFYRFVTCTAEDSKVGQELRDTNPELKNPAAIGAGIRYTGRQSMSIGPSTLYSQVVLGIS
jgi:hypothetical protein